LVKLLFLIFLVFTVIISGCSNVNDKEKVESKTIQQATLESNIPTADIFYTNKTDDSAFSLFHSPNGYGILHFSKKENGWVYQGNSGEVISMGP
jgi:hypothetical protein